MVKRFILTLQDLAKSAFLYPIAISVSFLRDLRRPGIVIVCVGFAGVVSFELVMDVLTADFALVSFTGIDELFLAILSLGEVEGPVSLRSPNN